MRNPLRSRACAGLLTTILLSLPVTAPAATGDAAAGERLFNTVTPSCGTCHAVKPGIGQIAPSLAGIATIAQARVKLPDYKGKARDARAYLRESIVHPNAYIVPGNNHSVNGQSLMPATYSQSLKPDQVEKLVDYLMTLK